MGANPNIYTPTRKHEAGGITKLKEGDHDGTEEEEKLRLPSQLERKKERKEEYKETFRSSLVISDIHIGLISLISSPAGRWLYITAPRVGEDTP